MVQRSVLIQPMLLSDTPVRLQELAERFAALPEEQKRCQCR